MTANGIASMPAMRDRFKTAAEDRDATVSNGRSGTKKSQNANGRGDPGHNRTALGYR